MPRFSTLLCWFSNVTSLKVTVVCNINGSLPNHVVILYQRTEKIQEDSENIHPVAERRFFRPFQTCYTEAKKEDRCEKAGIPI